MRYIYLKPIKTAADKKRAKNLPVLAKANLAKLIKDRVETKVVNPAKATAAAQRRLVLAEEARSALATAIKGRKTMLGSLLKRPADKLTKTPVLKRQGRPKRISLLSAESLLVDAYLLGKVRDNQAFAAAAFETLKDLMARSGVQLPTKQAKEVAALSKLQGLGGAQIARRRQQLCELWARLGPARVATDTDLTQPGREEGELGKTDRVGDGSCTGGTPDPDGLISLIQWPLKAHITSVKDQGNRGTCTAFGTISTVETAISVKYGRKVNLSEQDLYKTQRLDWSPSLTNDYNEDGYFPLVSMLLQIVSGYVFPWERDWEYNPSMARVPDGDGPWTMSCAGYNGLACSDTNHQAQRKTFVIRTEEVKEVVNEVCEYTETNPLLGIIGGWACNAVTDFIEVVENVEVTIYETNVAGTSRYKVSGWIPVWDPLWDTEITAAKLMLANKVPLIFCFNVPDSWRDVNQPSPGYIVYNAHETLPEDSGGHCVAVVGHLDNADIPAGSKIPPGAGGGWFILKNSWGACWADCGYAYAPYAWVLKWGTSLIAVTNVERI